MSFIFLSRNQKLIRIHSLLSEKILRTEFSGIRAVKVYANDTRRVWLDEACVNVVSSTDGKTRLLSPESEYLKISQNADTLVICLDLTTYDLPKQKKGVSYSGPAS